VIEDMNPLSSSGLFDQLSTFFVVCCLNGMLVDEVFLGTFVATVLEPVAVKTIFALLAGDVCDQEFVR
jgi:hypothetical protein